MFRFWFISIVFLASLALAVDPPQFRATLGTASAYVDGGWVTTPDPVMSTTIQMTWEGFYLRHWEEWDLSDYQSPERSGRYGNSRKYRIECCNYVGGYGHLIPVGDYTLRLAAQWKYNQYPRRRTYVKRANGEIHARHVKSTEAACFIGVRDWFPHDPLDLGTTLEIDYHTERYYWRGKVHVNASYPLGERWRAGIDQTLYWKPSRAHYISTGDTGFAFTVLVAYPYVRYDFGHGLSLRCYLGFAAALEHATRDQWRRNANNNRRNHWCGMTLVWNF